MNLLFFLNSLLFGVALAMDAFSVSLANGLCHPHMGTWNAVRIAGTFGLFQTGMPLLGWFCVRTVAETFRSFQRFIPWIALLLLLWLGVRMLLAGIRGEPEAEEELSLRGTALLVQGIATSIDALSVGFTIAEYHALMALTESVIIGLVTFLICMAGLRLGKRFGTRFSGKAGILGGVILILIGIEIFLKGIL